MLRYTWTTLLEQKAATLMTHDFVTASQPLSGLPTLCVTIYHYNPNLTNMLRSLASSAVITHLAKTPFPGEPCLLFLCLPAHSGRRKNHTGADWVTIFKFRISGPIWHQIPLDSHPVFFRLSGSESVVLRPTATESLGNLLKCKL